jgi:hypothetical protein
LNIETRDARNDPCWQSELVEQGGKYQVPCLRIDKGDDNVEWLYESKILFNISISVLLLINRKAGAGN